MPKVLLHVICETLGDQLPMTDGFEIEQILDVKRVGAERHWSIVVSREVPDDEESEEDDA